MFLYFNLRAINRMSLAIRWQDNIIISTLNQVFMLNVFFSNFILVLVQYFHFSKQRQIYIFHFSYAPPPSPSMQRKYIHINKGIGQPQKDLAILRETWPILRGVVSLKKTWSLLKGLGRPKKALTSLKKIWPA